MVTGLREFRKTLSKYVSFVKRGEIVVITDREKPIASFISTDKLRELARKANDEFVLSQLKEAQADKNKEFLENKKEIKEEISQYLKLAMEGKGRVPNSVIIKLQTIISTIDNLTSDDGTFEDQRILGLMSQKSHGPISRVLDFDYFHVHQEFINKVTEQVGLLIEKTTSRESRSNLSKDIKLLADMVENAIIRDKTNQDDRIGTSCSVLVKMTKNGKYYSSRIYTIMPFWYEKPRQFNYFIDRSSPIGIKLYGKKVGDSFQYNSYQFEILSIT